jgi:hypothetical protein
MIDAKSKSTTKKMPSGSSSNKKDHSTKAASKAKKPKSRHPTWIPLNSLAELDWNDYTQWTVANQTLLKDKVHIIGHDYEIRPVSPISGSHFALDLSAGERFLIIPIKEMGTAASQRRYVLAHEEHAFEKGQRLYLASAEPPKGAPAGGDAFYQRIYVIGDADPEATKQDPHIIGAVEAVLTVSDPLVPWTGFPAAPPIQIVPQLPAAVTAEPCSPPYDEDLLKRIDELNIIKERCDPEGKDIAVLQRKLNEYVRDRYGLSSIPIEVNRTRYDENVGHIMAKRSHLTFVDDGIITAVCRIGYARNGEIVRKANVVVNRHATQIVRLTELTFAAANTLQVKMSAPEGFTIGELIREAAMQIDTLDELYEWIHIFAAGSPVKIKDLARRLLQTNLTHEIPREILKEANSRHLERSSLIHGSHMLLTLCGDAKSLKKLSDILYIEACGRTNKRYYPAPEDGWIFKELRGLQQFLPRGIDEARFTKDSDRILCEILERITFARDFQFPGMPKQAPKDGNK